MSDNTTTWQDMLFAMNRHVAPFFLATGPFMDMLERDIAERKRKDAAYLASLTPGVRAAVVTRRRVRRLRSWWETDVAWRLRARPPEREGWS